MEKTCAAASVASVSTPTLKSSWWKTLRRAVQSTAAIVSAATSAPRGPTMAAPASAPTAVTEIVPVRSTSIESAWAAPTSATIASSAATSALGAVKAAKTPMAMPAMPIDADEDREARRHGEEARPDARMRRARCGARRSTGGDGSGARVEQRRRRLAASARLGGGTAARRGARLTGLREQRLVRGVEDAVAPLDLRAVDGEVGLVDELVRVAAVARERRTPSETVTWIGSLEVSTSNSCSATARRMRSAISQRGLRLGLRQQDRELLAAEARRHVVVAQLLAEDPRDAGQDGVAGEVAVRVVDVAQQVEVGHDQRHRPLEPRRPRRAPRAASPRSAGR